MRSDSYRFNYNDLTLLILALGLMLAGLLALFG